MKALFYPIISVFICLILLPLVVCSQTTLPSNFRLLQQSAYDKLPNKEISFEQYYKIKQAIYQQQQILLNHPSMQYQHVAIPTPTDNTCTNGNLENGPNPPYWQGGRGSINAQGVIDYGNFIGGISSGALTDTSARQTPVGRGFDPHLLSFGDSLATTTGVRSFWAVRIGNARDQNGAELLSKSFTVTAANSRISFKYAVVLQDPAHRPFEQPAFQVRVINNATGLEVPNLVNLGNGSNRLIANSRDPFFITAGWVPDPPNDSVMVVYRKWQCAQIDLSSLVRSSVTIQFVTNDCTQGAHYGYAYIDDFCSTCENSPGGNVSPDPSSSSTCGKTGNICCKFQVPRGVNGLMGAVTPRLKIYYDGNIIQTLTGPNFTADGSYCFSVTPAIVGRPSFDYVLEGVFTLNGVTLPSVSAGNSHIGQGAGVNDDYWFNCVQQCCMGVNGTPSLHSDTQMLKENTQLLKTSIDNSHEKIRVYPNPADEIVTVAIPSQSSKTVLKLLDISGKQIRSLVLPPSETKIQLSLKNVPAGLYLLQITSADGKSLLDYRLIKR